MISDPDMMRVHGTVVPGYLPVRTAFELNFREGRECGAAFAAYVDGKLVVDLWAGMARREDRTPWNRDTLVGFFSGTKGLVATCMMQLVERDILALDAAVCQYWPEFAAHGKSSILVSDVLTHQAGLAALETPVTIHEAEEPRRMAELLAGQRPRQPKSGPRYHAMTFGWLCAELIRRTDGRSTGQFLQDEIAYPLGLEMWIGLPEEQEARVALFERSSDFHLSGVETRVDPSDPTTLIWSNPPRFVGPELAANTRHWRAAEVPASNGVVTARSVARLYGCLAVGGTLDGTQVLSGSSVEMIGRDVAHGFDPSLPGSVAFSMGYQVQTDARPLGPPPDAFGHAGAGGSVHGAWPSLRTGFSYTPNLLGSIGPSDRRGDDLLAALYQSALLSSAGSPSTT